MMNLLTESAASAGGGIALMVIYIVIIGAAMYFFAIRPQKKEQRRMTAMLSALEIGDTVVTTSGFYGVVIDITDEEPRRFSVCGDDFPVSVFSRLLCYAIDKVKF